MRNVIAVDAINVLALEALVKVSSVDGVSVCHYVSGVFNTTVVAISGADADISEDDLMNDNTACKKVIYARRFGFSISVKIAFAGDAHLSHVKANSIRYLISPFVPRATRCLKA